MGLNNGHPHCWGMFLTQPHRLFSCFESVLALLAGISVTALLPANFSIQNELSPLMLKPISLPVPPTLVLIQIPVPLMLAGTSN